MYVDRSKDHTQRIPKIDDETIIVSKPPTQRKQQPKTNVPNISENMNRSTKPIFKVRLQNPITTGMQIGLGIFLSMITMIIISWILWLVISLLADGWIVGGSQ